MDQIEIRIEHLEAKVFVLAGVIVGLLVAFVCFCVSFRKVGRPKDLRFSRIYSIISNIDDDLSSVLPLSFDSVVDGPSGAVVEYNTVSLINLGSSPGSVDITVGELLANYEVVSRHRLPYVKSNTTRLCNVKVLTGKFLVEEMTRRVGIPGKQFHIVSIERRLRFGTDCSLSGLVLEDTGFEWLFVPTRLNPVLSIEPAKFTQIFKWTGSDYRMVCKRGKYLVTPIFDYYLYVEKVVCFRKRPHWYLTPEAGIREFDEVL